MWFENSSNESMLLMDKKICLVATPQGTPSPPELTSTVARPILQRKIVQEVDVDGSFVQRQPSKKIQFLENANDSGFKVPTSKLPPFDVTANDGRSSLGLLPPETLACTMTGNATLGSEPVFQFGPEKEVSKAIPPSPEVAEEQIASELDRLRFSGRSLGAESTLEVPPADRKTEDVTESAAADVSAENVIPKKDFDATSATIASLPSNTSSDLKSTFTDKLPDKYFLPTPHHLADNQSCVQGLSYFLDSTCESMKTGLVGNGRIEFPSGVDFLITPKLVRAEENDQKNMPLHSQVSKSFADDSNANPFDANPVSNPFDENPLDHHQDSNMFDENSVANPFGEFLSQDVTIGAGEKFEDLSTDVMKKFFDAEEEENAREFQFMQEEECEASDASSRNQASDFKNNTGEKNSLSTSMTEYFRFGTSRIGFSFDQSLSGSSIQKFRPNFGFGTIVSPDRQPVAVVEPFNEDEAAKDTTLTPNASDHPQDQTESTTDAEIDTSRCQKSFNDEGQKIDVSGIQNGASYEKSRHLNDKSAQTTKFELLCSLLEDTVAQTLCRSGISDPAEASVDLVTAIISKTSPDLDARTFAKTVLESLRRHKRLQASPTTFNVTPLSDLLPSFLNDTVVADVSLRENVLRHVSFLQNSFKNSSRDVWETPFKENVPASLGERRSSRGFLRHSSPIKSRQPLATLPPLVDAKQTSRRLNVSDAAPPQQLLSKIEAASSLSSQTGNSRTLAHQDVKESSVLKPLCVKESFGTRPYGGKDFCDRMTSKGSNQSPDATLDAKTTHSFVGRSSDVMKIEMICPFPIECNRKSVLWISNKSENQKEEILLKNVLRDQPVVLSATIQDSDEFCFPNESRQALDIYLKPGETKAIQILFLPSLRTSGQWVHGKLILKPRGFKAGKKRFKAAVFLQAKNELPILNFTSARFLARTNGTCDLKLDPDTFVSNVEVSNFGTGPAFVSFVCNERNISIRPNHFILDAEQKLIVEIKADAVDTGKVVLGRVKVVFGPETGRKILKNLGELNAGSGYEHLSEKFSGEDQVVLGSCNLQYLTRENLTPVLSSLERFEFDILYIGDFEKRHPNGPEQPIKFYELVSEETFATDYSLRLSMGDRRWQRASVRNGEIEMAIRGSDAALILHRQHFHESEEDRMTEGDDASEKAVTIGSQRSASSSHSEPVGRDPVYLADTSITFRENETAKIGIRNRTASFQNFEFVKLNPPFYSAFKKFTVRPNFYLNIPVKFVPDPGSRDRLYESEAVLKNSSTGSILRCSLIGRSTSF